MSEIRHATDRLPLATGTTVLVAGATGVLGREVAHLLGERGFRVRSFSRDPARAETLRGVVDEIVLGDATDPASLARACTGVDAVVSCLGAPMTVAPADRSSFFAVDTVANRNLAAAAVGAGVARFVYVSIFLRPAWARTRYVLAHEEVVDELRRSGLSFGVVRPTGLFPIRRSWTWPGAAPCGSLATEVHRRTRSIRPTSPRPAWRRCAAPTRPTSPSADRRR